MSKAARSVFITGTAFMLLGSFLPWRVEGDVLPVRTYGIEISSVRVFYAHGAYALPVIHDNGGILIVLLCLIMLGLFVSQPAVLQRPQIWTIVLAAVAVFLSGLHVVSLAADAARQAGSLGAPTIQIGLVMVSAGSLLALAASLSPLVSPHTPM